VLTERQIRLVVNKHVTNKKEDVFSSIIWLSNINSSNTFYNRCVAL